MATQIKITKIDTMPQIDPYHRDTGTPTTTGLIIDPQERTVAIAQDWDDNATPIEEWTGRVLHSKLYARPDEDAARSYLEGDEAQALLERIVDGHSIEWDGNNMTGGLNSDGNEAYNELVNTLESLPESEWSIWQVDDYLNDAVRNIIQPMTTDDELRIQATEIDATAEADHIIIDGDVL